MKKYAFIFARGGSKGLPNKNLLKINNKSLVQHSIECALDSMICDRVFISSDSDDILDLAGNDVIKIKRPHNLSNDNAAEWSAWQHAIKFAEKRYGNFEIFISLPPTSPLKNISDIKNCISTLQNSFSDICLSITPSHNNPFFNMVQKDDGYIKLFNQSSKKKYNRQEVKQCFNITTNVYCAKKDFILEKNHIFDGKVSFIEIPKNRSIDIDDEFDFELAKMIMEKK